MVKHKVAVIGGGSWATAIVKILSQNLPTLQWWVREPEIVEGVLANGRNPLYLSSASINNKRVKISNNLKKVVAKSDIIFLVVPSSYLFSTLEELNPKLFEGKSVISAVKGIVPEQMEMITDYLKNYFKIDQSRLGIISGPSHAEEVAQEKLTYLTSASRNEELAKDVAELFSCHFVRTDISTDIFGIEFAVVLKNIYALATGIFRGMGAGDNLLALFNSNCINEMIHFISSIYPNPNRNFHTSPYLGDFLVTCYSQHSRNRSFGIMIGQGYSVRTAQLEMKMVAEGYNAVRCIYEINKKHQIEIPIIDAVYRILYEKASFKIEMYRLLEKMK